jgi:RHS repeat-associated protein
LCAANPEVQIVACPASASGPFPAGAITYSYDPNSNLSSKVAPLPNQTGTSTVTTNYSYDALNRLTGKSYVGMSTVGPKFGYDGVAPAGCTPPSLTDSYPVGLRTAMCDASGATSWSHNKMNREASEKRIINGSVAVTNTTSYAYNLDGSLATLTYPSGRIITYTQSGAGRTLSAVESAHSLNYVTTATYAPQGAPAGLMNGASITGLQTYNDRLQLLQLYYTNATPAPVTQLQTTACPTTAATIMSSSYTFGAGTNDNGNVHQVTNCLNTNRTQNFDYDALNRIKDGYTTGTGSTLGLWGEVYTIDPWGNLTNIGLYPGQYNSETLNAPANVANQLTGFGYDAAGNMTSNSPSTYTYDAENRLVATPYAGFTYVYDGDGTRVVKCSGTYPTCSTATLYWPGPSGTLAEDGWTGTQTEEYIFFNGKRVARRDGANNSVDYYFSDHLGSTDVITGNGGGISHASLFYPFGGEIEITGPTFANNYKFTGKERDAESNLDYFGARHYGSTLARFMQPDEPFGDQNAKDPQSWNLYSYVRDMPLNSTDPSGRSHCVQTGVPDTLHCYTDKEWDQLQRAREVEEEMYADIVGQTDQRARSMLALDRFARRANPIISAYMTVLPIIGEFSVEEQSIADALSEEGQEVVPLAVVEGQKNPDALVDGVKTEFKTITTAGPNTLKNRIEDGLKQASNVVVDVRGTSISKAQALQQIQRVEGNVGSLQGRITVLTNEGTLKH